MTFLRLLITILKLGLIALATGCLAFAIILALLFYDGFPIELILQIASASALAAGVIGFIIDSKFGITRSIFSEIARNNFDKAIEIYQFQGIVTTALLKYFEGVYYDSLASEFLQNILKNPYKQEYYDRIFIVENILPQIQQYSGLTTKSDLKDWIELVEEARGCLIAVREAINSINFFSRWLNPFPLTLTQATVELWKSKYSKVTKKLLFPSTLSTITAETLYSVRDKIPHK